MRSQTLSGWPSETDSLVKTKSCFAKDHLPLNRLHQSPGLPLAAQFRSGRDRPLSPGALLSNAAPRASSPIFPERRPEGAGRGLFRLTSSGKTFRQTEHLATQRLILDTVKGLDQLNRSAPLQQVGLE